MTGGEREVGSVDEAGSSSPSLFDDHQTLSDDDDDDDDDYLDDRVLGQHDISSAEVRRSTLSDRDPELGALSARYRGQFFLRSSLLRGVQILLFAFSHNSKNARPNLTKFVCMLPVAMARSSLTALRYVMYFWFCG